MTAYFTRDSVCAGDDGDAPHGRRIELPPGESLQAWLTLIIAAARLPQIAGGKATWSLCSIEPLAVIAEQWPEPKFTQMIPPKLASLDIAGDELRLHFNYHGQQDPEVVFNVLRRVRARSS